MLSNQDKLQSSTDHRVLESYPGDLCCTFYDKSRYNINLCLEPGEKERYWPLKPIGWAGTEIRNYRCGKNLITNFHALMVGSGATWHYDSISSATPKEV